MASLYKRGNVWWVKGRDAHGSWYRKSTKQTNKRAAERVKQAIELEHALPPEIPPLLLKDALDMAWAQMELKQRAQPTMEAANLRGAHLCRVFHRKLNVHTLGPADTDRYMAQRREEGVSDHTIAKEITHLLASLRAAKRLGRYPGEPRNLWPDALTGYYTPRTRWLPVHEYAALLRQATAHRRDYIVTYCHTGIRYGELYKIQPEHVDLKGRRVFIDGTKTRAAKRWVPLSEDAFGVLSRRADLEPMFPTWYKGRMNADLKKWCEKAGIDRVSTNDFRRTFASWMVNASVPEIVTCKLLGHTNSAMVRKVYAQLSEDVMIDAIGRLPSVPNVYAESVIPIRKRRESEVTDKTKGRGKRL